MKTFAALSILGVASATDAYTQKYMQYLSNQSKSYNSIEEFDMRLQNFIAIDKFIEEWNAQEDKTHTVGHNFISDWTQAEKDIISGKAAKNAEKRLSQSTESSSVPLNVSAYDANWDWRSQGKVGAV